MTLKILLAEPHIKYPVVKSHLGFNLGLLSVASYSLENLSNLIDISLFSQRLNKACGELRDIDAEIRRTKPTIVGVSALTCDFPDAINTIRIAKKYGARTILGGVFPTSNDNWIIENYPEVDIVVRGDGCVSFCEILKAERESTGFHKVNGITYRDSEGTTRRNDNRELMRMEDMPMLRYDLLPLEKYKKLGLPASVLVSIGCKFSCVFCTIKDTWCKTHRSRLNSQIIEELEILGVKHGFKKVKLVDDIITIRQAHKVKTILEEMAERHVDLRFRINSRLDLMNAEMLANLHHFGVDELLLGVESVSEQILKKVHKPVKHKMSKTWGENAIKIAKLAAHIGYTVFPTFVLGLPGETKETLRRATEFAVEIGCIDNVIPYLSFATPHPGSEFHLRSSELGMQILTFDLRRYTHLFPVAVPRSLGVNGLTLLVDSYNFIAETTDTKNWNPPIDQEYLRSLTSSECRTNKS